MEKKKRAESLKGRTRQIKTGCGNLYITLNRDEEGNLFECFARLGKGGGCAASQNEAIGRLASLALRYAIPPEEIVEKLKGIVCHNPHGEDDKKIWSCADGIARTIEKVITDKKKVPEKDKVNV